MDIFWSWPPITRTLLAGIVVTSISVHLGPLNPLYVIFLKDQIFCLPPRIPEIWRLVMPFLMSSPGLGLIMDPYLLYSYSSVLERDSPRFTELGSYFVYLTFVSTVIVALCGYYLEGYVFLQPLILAFAYTFSQENPNANVTMWFLTFPAKFLPLALLFLTFVMAGPGPAKQQLTGLIAAHLYDFLIRIWPMFGGGRNVLATPMFVKRWFGANRGEQRRAYGTAVFAREQVPRSEPQFGQRGPGRRLGD